MINVSDFKNIERVIELFEEFSKIPHGSGNTALIADYLVRFAEERGLCSYRDEYDNVIIRKPATPGMEDRPTVILQGHTDMVAVKLPDFPKDLEREGVEMYRDGDFLRAKGTSLGEDDGIAVAYALAILESSDIAHPALECLFTSDEEIGLIGAAKLDAAALNGKIMLNLDSDDEDVFTVGCAGGARVDVTLGVTVGEPLASSYRLTVSGGLGGHSGAEIHKGRANAIKLGASVLAGLGDLRLSAMQGGAADNAIPRDFTAVFSSDEDPFIRLEKIRDGAVAQYLPGEPELTISLERCDEALPTLDERSSKKLLDMINELPSGIVSMSSDVEGLVETSLNAGIIELCENALHLTFSVRSAKAAAKEALIERIHSISESYGASIAVRGEYPAWEYKKDSHVRDVSVSVFEKVYGKRPEVIIIHAGLECGVFSGKMPELDCISFGPDSFDIHTTEEHLSLSSTSRFFEFLKAVLKEI
jgi:dipeptidase D